MEGRKTFMGKIDVATKQYMSHKNVIADAFNFYVYDLSLIHISFDTGIIFAYQKIQKTVSETIIICGKSSYLS